MSAEFNDLEEYFRQENFVRSYSKGQVICSQGDLFNYVYMVKSGMVKIYDLDVTGSERTITVFSRHNVFPIVWMLQNPPSTHLYNYEAFTDVSCYLVPLAKVKKHISTHPEILPSLTDTLTKAYVNFIARIENLEKSRVHERMEFVLYMLAMRLGAIHENTASINAFITQEDIASLAGVTRETMSVEINKARSKGIIWREGHKTFINLALIDVEAMPPMFAN